MHEVLVNRLGGLSLPRKSVVRLTDRPDMTLDVYRGGKTTNQQIKSYVLGTDFFRCIFYGYQENVSVFYIYYKMLFTLAHCILVDSSTVICWTSPYVIFKDVRSILSLLFYF